MWICSRLGFFSVVRKADGLFHVRARRRQDLENLAAELPKIGRPVVHTSDPSADYRFRIVTDAAGWNTLAGILMASVDYGNFKGIIGATRDQADKLGIYSDFHHDMEQFQRDSDGDAPPEPRLNQ